MQEFDVSRSCCRNETQAICMYLPDLYSPLITPLEERLGEIQARRGCESKLLAEPSDLVTFP